MLFRLLGLLTLLEESIQALGEMIDFFKESVESQIAQYVTRAIFSKGICLNILGKMEEGIQIYSELITQYKDRPEPQISDYVTSAMVLKGGALGKKGFIDEEAKMYHQAIEHNEENILGWEKLISLTLEKRKDQKEALRIAETCINKNLKNPIILNSIAWIFYKHGDKTSFDHAEKWSKEALRLAPNEPNYHHTVACLLAATNRVDEALQHAGEYLKNNTIIENSIDEVIELFIELAVVGVANEALALLVKSLGATALEPLIIGLKLFMNEDVKAAAEIMEIARDIVKRINERQESNKTR